MINNPNDFNKCMYKMEKTEENELIEDLIMTGSHEILVDGDDLDLKDYLEKTEKTLNNLKMIDDKYLLRSVFSNKFKKIENNQLYNYYLFSLENDIDKDQRFGVWANGILIEIPSRKHLNLNKLKLL
jgi:hypothetical protein